MGALRRRLAIGGAHRTRLAAIPLRISVTGIRGKSTLVTLVADELRARGLRTYAKITGSDPLSIVDGVAHPIVRPRDATARLEETMRELERWWSDELDALILENQAITPYTMRIFNQAFCRPTHVLITNVRRDHLGDLAATASMQARAFAQSIPSDATVISGVQDPAIASILRKGMKGVEWIDAAPDPDDALPPGAEAITILDALLLDVFGIPLDTDTRARHLRTLDERYTWRRSSIPGVVWFDGADINDVDSTLLVSGYLQRDPMPLTYIAVFRADRRDRTASFARMFAEQLDRGACDRVYLLGPGARVVARRLRRWRERVRVFPDRDESPDAVLAGIERECGGGAVMTVANGTPPLARALAARLTERSIVHAS